MDDDEKTPDEETEVVETEETQSDELLKAKEGLLKEKQKLEADIKQLREERRNLRIEEEQTEEPEEQETPPLDEVLKPVNQEFSMLKDSQRKKAVKQFVKRHPEYANDDDDSQLMSLIKTYERVKSRSVYDSDDILDDMEDAWAVLHREKLYEKEQMVRQNEVENDIRMNDVASSHGGHYEQTDKSFEDGERPTKTDVRIAERIGMDIKKYMKLKRQASEAEIS